MRILYVLFLLFLAMTPTSALAHSGRTDSNGGHNCSAKSIAKGLCSGYHYHNGGSTGSTYVSPTTTPIKTAAPTIKTPTSTLKPTPTPVVTASPVVLETSEPTIPEVAGVSTEENDWSVGSTLASGASIGALAWVAQKALKKKKLSH